MHYPGEWQAEQVLLCNYRFVYMHYLENKAIAWYHLGNIKAIVLEFLRTFPHHREHSFQTTGIFHAFSSKGGYNINSFISQVTKLTRHGQNTLRCQEVCSPAPDRPHPPVTSDLFAVLLGKTCCLSETTKLLKSTSPSHSQAWLPIAWGFCQLLFLLFSASD